EAGARTRMNGTARHIETGANLGFSGGMNRGIRAALDAGATRILLANSDVIVPPDGVAHLEEVLAAMPAAGIVGPAILARADPRRVVSLGLSYAAASGRFRHRAHGTPTSALEPRQVTCVDAVAGCLMLIR